MDTSKLAKLAGIIDDLKNVPSRASRTVADALNDLLEEEFAQAKDAYGRPWKPLAPATLRKHSPPALTDAGELRAGTMARPLPGKGVELDVPFPGVIHQTGTSDGHVPARPILPTGGLPVPWRNAIRSAIKQAFKR